MRDPGGTEGSLVCPLGVVKKNIRGGWVWAVLHDNGASSIEGVKVRINGERGDAAKSMEVR
jgi:hypothetical protein